MKGYLATRSGMKVGLRTLDVGMPFPGCDVTPSLLAAKHVREVATDSEEYQAAVAAHGEPPERIPASGEWAYRKGAAPKAPAVQTSAKRPPKAKKAKKAKAPVAPTARRRGR